MHAFKAWYNWLSQSKKYICDFLKSRYGLCLQNKTCCVSKKSENCKNPLAKEEMQLVFKEKGLL